jgi:hypothetical protein
VAKLDPKKKYLHSETIAQMQPKNGASQFWARLLKVKDIFFISSVME